MVVYVILFCLFEIARSRLIHHQNSSMKIYINYFNFFFRLLRSFCPKQSKRPTVSRSVKNNQLIGIQLPETFNHRISTGNKLIQNKVCDEKKVKNSPKPEKDLL